MNFVKIAWRDISSIFKNRFIRVSVTAIIIVPLLYSLLYLAAFWDPYSKLQKVPVAVVNLDKGSTKDNESVNYGNDMVDKLKDNTNMGWRFVSLDKAQKGLKGKDYYAMFVIPEDFSEKVLSAKSGSPEKPHLTFSTNDKKNFLAAQINSKVSLELKDEIVKQITEEYTEVTFDKLYDVKDGMNKASDGSSKLNDGIVTAKNGSSDLKNGISTLSSNIPAMQDGISKLYNGSNDLYNGLGKLKEGAVKLEGGLAMLNKVPSLVDGLKQLFNGTSSFMNGIASASGGAGNLSTGITSAANGANTIYSGITTNAVDKNGNPLGLKSGMNVLDGGIHKIDYSINTADKDASGNPLGLIAGAQAVNDGAKKLNYAISTSDKDASGNPVGLLSGVKALDGGINAVNNALNAPSGIKNGAASVASGVDQMVSMQSTMTGYIQSYIKAHPEALKDPNMQQLAAVLSDPEVAKNAAALKTGSSSLRDGINTLSSQVNSGLVPASTKITAGTTLLSQQISGALVPGTNGLANGTKQLGAAFKTQLTPGADKLAAGVGSLETGMGQLTTGLNAASKGAGSLSSGLNQLNAGAVKFGSSLGAANLTPQAAGGINALYEGSKELVNSGIDPLYAGAGSLKDGLSLINSKVPELADGTNKLYDGSVKLNDGMIKLADGSKELNDKLKDGSDEINKSLVNDSKSMGKFVSEPVVLDQKPINEIKNYGTGFTPYFIPLSLWVGAIMMFFIITDKVDDDIKASSAAIVAGKFLSYGYIGILQAVLASIVVLALGLKPSNILAYFLFNVFMSFVFIAIIQSLIFLLGDAGRLVSIVLLILQLTSCGGTFPMEVVPKFFNVLNPFMPFTYCVSALREIISGIDYTVFTKDIGVLAGMLFGFLIISMLMKGHADKVKAAIEGKKEQEAQIA